jgi:mannitol-specific phosphotransferase system IIBC component
MNPLVPWGSAFIAGISSALLVLFLLIKLFACVCKPRPPENKNQLQQAQAQTIKTQTSHHEIDTRASQTEEKEQQSMKVVVETVDASTNTPNTYIKMKSYPAGPRWLGTTRNSSADDISWLH